jgi:hypothetical protein
MVLARWRVFTKLAEVMGNSALPVLGHMPHEIQDLAVISRNPIDEDHICG